MNKRYKLLSILLSAGIVASVFPSSGTGATSDSIAFYNSKKSILEMKEYNEAYDTNHDGVVNVFDVIRENKEVFQEESYTDLKAQIHSLETQIEILTQKLTEKEDKTQAESDLSEINSLLSGKVGQQEGKQLSSNDYTDKDKNKLDSLENYNDSGIKSEISSINSELSSINYTVSGKVDQQEGKQLSSNDYTDSEKEKLDGLENYDDTKIKEKIDSLVQSAYEEKKEIESSIDNKVNKEEGKQLSSNDYTNEEKQKLESLNNYDDTKLKGEISQLKSDSSMLEEICNSEKQVTISFEYNGAIDFENGSFIYTGSFKSTDFINIDNVVKITAILQFYAPSYADIAYYDENKTYISGFTGASLIKPIVITDNIPYNAKYVRFSTDSGSVDSSSVVIDKVIPINYTVSENSENIERLEDATIKPSEKTWAVCGDSITHANHVGIEDIDDKDDYCPFACTDGLPDDGVSTIYKRKNYAYYIAKENQLRWANYGWGGSTLTNCTVGGEFKNGFSVDRYKQLKDGVNFDYISLFFGYNDNSYGTIQQREIWLKETYGTDIYWTTNSSLFGTGNYVTEAQYNACMAVTGSVGGIQYNDSEEYFHAKFIGTVDDTDNHTWCGAWNTVLPYLMLKYPNAKILIIVPYSQGNDGWINDKQKDMTIAMANKWSIPYYDFRDTCHFLDENTTPIAGYESVRKYRQSYLTTDGLHPSTEGYKYIYPSIGAKLMGI